MSGKQGQALHLFFKAARRVTSKGFVPDCSLPCDHFRRSLRVKSSPGTTSGVVIVAGVKASKTDEPYSRVPFPARLPIVVQV